MTAILPLVESLGELEDPATVAERFLDLPYMLLLDSATGAHAGGDPHPLGRFSFLAADPAMVIRSKGSRTEIGDEAGWRAAEGDPLDVARRILASWRIEPAPGLPPFQGGAAGYLGYDYGAVLERLPAPRYDDLAIRDVVLGLYDWVIAWDHRVGAAWLVSTGLPATGAERSRRAGARIEMVRRRLAGPGASGAAHPPVRRGRADADGEAPSYALPGIDGAEAVGLRSTFTHRGYIDAVTRVREYIVVGDIFQANLSQRFQAPLTEPPFELYCRLRRRNPAAFAAYLGFDDVTVLSASPERFLQLDQQRRQVETRPIKGTRPRGLGPMHDAALGQALSESDKDRSENVMIVDLLRNDLSRVCRPGTVRVPELFALEQHPTVHHLVSTVVGELAVGADAVDLVRAAFPGGSITGAPKVRAMEIIAELEDAPRGIYTGAFGVFDPRGDFELGLPIRTAVVCDGVLTYQAGGGIVADSDPDLELAECWLKTEALRRALEPATPKAQCSSG